MSFLLSIKKWVVTTIILLLISFSLFAYPLLQDTANYGTIPIISYQDAQNSEYTILEDGGDHMIIEIDGVAYYVKIPSS